MFIAGATHQADVRTFNRYIGMVGERRQSCASIIDKPSVPREDDFDPLLAEAQGR